MLGEVFLRVRMLESKTVEASPESHIQYAAGEVYNVPEEQARQWINDGAAADPDAPVVADIPSEPVQPAVEEQPQIAAEEEQHIWEGGVE